jgi:hypothetical protein
MVEALSTAGKRIDGINAEKFERDFISWNTQMIISMICLYAWPIIAPPYQVMWELSGDFPCYTENSIIGS